MYFEHFPVLRYTLDGGKTYRMMRDITIRTRVNEEIIAHKALYQFYTVSDESTPDDISTEVYGSPHFHWVILLVNDMIDPRMDWIWSEAKVRKYTFEKYKKQSDIDAIYQAVEEDSSLNLDHLLLAYERDVLSVTHHYEQDGEWVQPTASNAIGVSNYQHEVRENEKKREIRILDPQHLQSFLRNFKRIIND